MKTRRKLAGLLAALLLLALLPPAQDAGLVPTAHAVTQKEIDNLKDDAKGLKSERQDIESQLSKLKNDKNDAIKKRNLLDDQIAVTVREIENIASQISGYEALLEQTAYELEVNQQQEADQYALFCNRARAMEKSGTTSYWAVLFKASSFSDLLSRLSDIQAVMNYDQSVLDELRRIHVEIEEKHAYQEQLKTEAEQAKAEQEAKKVELDGQRKAADDLVKELQANEEIAAALLAEKEAEEKRIQEAIKKKEKELEEQMRAAQMNWTATAGGYIWPENASKKITSPYGSRSTGIRGASTNHKGVDIGGVGYSTSVLATKAGVVITSEKSSSYGNYVVISHGPGNTTLYAHMSSRSVKEGDVVSQGQVIGVTGSTGISSGPHLHYEIKEGGSRIDPRTYLPGWIQAY